MRWNIPFVFFLNKLNLYVNLEPIIPSDYLKFGNSINFTFISAQNTLIKKKQRFIWIIDFILKYLLSNTQLKKKNRLQPFNCIIYGGKIKIIKLTFAIIYSKFLIQLIYTHIYVYKYILVGKMYTASTSLLILCTHTNRAS